MKIVIFPDRIYKDPRANAPCPLDHSVAANWANVIVYSKDANVPLSHRTGALSIKCVFYGQEIYEIEGNHYAVDDKSYLIVNHQQPYAFGADSRQPYESLSFSCRKSRASRSFRAIIFCACSKLLSTKPRINI